MVGARTIGSLIWARDSRWFHCSCQIHQPRWLQHFEVRQACISHSLIPYTSLSGWLALASSQHEGLRDTNFTFRQKLQGLLQGTLRSHTVTLSPQSIGQKQVITGLAQTQGEESTEGYKHWEARLVGILETSYITTVIIWFLNILFFTSN